MLVVRSVSVITLLALCSGAQAAIAFSFADPGGGRQLTNTANGGGAGIGSLTYDTNAAINFIVDSSSEGGSTNNFANARLEMTNLNLGAAQTINGITMAPISGTFTFYDFTNNVRSNILSGTCPTGSFVRVGNTNSLMFSSSQGLQYTAGPALIALLGNLSVGDPQEAVFTLTDITVNGGGPLTGPGGVFNSFTANTSYSGNVAPTPGSIAILALAAGMFARRRSRI